MYLNYEIIKIELITYNTIYEILTFLFLHVFHVNHSTQSNKFLSLVTIAFHALCFYSRIAESIIATLVIDYTKLCMKTGIGRIYWQQQRILKF